MYEFFVRGIVQLSDEQYRAAVSHHQGRSQDFLRRHYEDARRASSGGVPGVRELAPYLLQRIADPRTLRLAWDFLARRGGQAPGPNGHRYQDYTSSEVWDFCKCLAHAIRAGRYRPGPERVVMVNKASGQGQRPIVLLNIADRVVQRAIVLILQAVLDPLLDDRSFGYRPQLGHLHALALAEHLTLSEGRRVWLAEDIRDAFQHVPLRRLLQVIEKVLPDTELVGLLERVLTGEKLPGLRQGGSLSPLMLNWYLHSFLDRPWRRDCSEIPLVRVADDLLALCTSRKQARAAYGHLDRLLLPAAMPLKGSIETAIHDLSRGETVDWLGFTIRQAGGVLAAGIGARSWTSLEEGFSLAHTKDNSSLRAYYLVRDWLTHRGPCYAWSAREQVCQRIMSLAQAYSFEEVPSNTDLLRHWQTAYARWCRLRSAVRRAYQSGEPDQDSHDD